MAQQLVVDFVAELARTVDLSEPIVEFGSLQVEAGQPNDLRPVFAGRRFIGTDMRHGPGVDRIEDLRALTFADREIGTALCLDTLEHCEDPFAACRELHRVLVDGGLCVLSSVMFFPIHGYPHDYWRFTPDGFGVLLSMFDDVWITGVGHPTLPTQIVAVARKGRRLDFSPDELGTLRAAQDQYDRAEGKVRFKVMQVSPREAAQLLLRELPRAALQRAQARLSHRA